LSLWSVPGAGLEPTRLLRHTFKESPKKLETLTKMRVYQFHQPGKHIKHQNENLIIQKLLILLLYMLQSIIIKNQTLAAFTILGITTSFS